MDTVTAHMTSSADTLWNQAAWFGISLGSFFMVLITYFVPQTYWRFSFVVPVFAGFMSYVVYHTPAKGGVS